MLDSLCTKQVNRVRQASIITSSSADTMSTITTTAISKNVRIQKGKGRAAKEDDGGHGADANSHHSQSSADDESSLVSVRSGISRCCRQGTLALRRWQLFQMVLLPFIPIVALIVQNSTLLSSVVVNLQEAWEMKQQINTIVQIGKLLTELQQERAELGFCLFTNTPESLENSSYHQQVSSRSNRQVFIYNYTQFLTSKRSIPHRSAIKKTDPTSEATLHPVKVFTSATIIPALSPLVSFPSVSSMASPGSITPTLLSSSAPLHSPTPSHYSHHEKGMSDKMQNSLCRTSLSMKFDRTEKVVKNLSTYVSNYVPTVESLREKRERIFQLTAKNDSADDTALNELLWYNVANDVILDLLSDQIRKTTTSGVWKVLIAYKNMIRCIENHSISMIYGMYYFGKGKLSQDSYNKFIKFDSLAADYLNATKSFSPEVTALWDRLIGHTWRQGYVQMTQRRAIIYRNDREETQPDAGEARAYYANMTIYIDELRKFQTRLKIMIDDKVMDEMLSARIKKVVAASLLILVILISPIIIFLVRNVTLTIQSYSVVLTSKTADLKREKRKSDRLLQQMLPAEVIRQLRARKQVPAESFESVTIYFSDIVSFTAISASSSPMEIVVMLNSLYKMFDSRIENYDVYKVETIGDAYMVVSGLPLRNGNQHAGEICTMALDLVAGIRNFEIPHKPGTGLHIRVGINTGCCVAGVVGTKMPRYCLFGDAINVASRMESHGQPMKIHITESTKVILDQIGGFITEERGVLEIKGKGIMNTFWLVDKVGGIPRTLEMTTPGFFRSESTSTNHTPDYMRDIFGQNDGEDDKGEMMEAVQLNVANLATDASQSSHRGSMIGGGHQHVPRTMASYLPTRFQSCRPV